MYYDDQARQFNFVSGLLFGAVLGAGLALLASSQDRVRRTGRRRRPGRDWAALAASGLDRLRDEVAQSVSDAAASGRERLRR